MRERKRKKNGTRIFLSCLCVFLSLVLVAMVAGTIWMESMLSMLGRSVDNSSLSASEYEELYGMTMDPAGGADAPLIEDDDQIINILLIGQDRRDGEGRQRSDAMILCTLNLRTKSLTMTSFMRDMYVQIPGYGENRLNACYQIGGMRLLDQCLRSNFGIEVDGNIEVDFGGFVGVIDMIGGVDIELNADEAAYLNKRGNWGVSDTAGTWELTEGMNHLSGDQALAYSRVRYVGNADFGRTERQRKVLNAVLEKCKDMNVAQLYTLARQVLPLMTTDMTNAQIVNYAMKVFPIVSKVEVSTFRVPADGAYYDAQIDGMSVLVPDLQKNRELLKEKICG